MLPGNKPPKPKRVRIGGKSYETLGPEYLLRIEKVPKRIILLLKKNRDAILKTESEVYLGRDATGAIYYGKRVIDDAGTPRTSIIIKTIEK